MRGGRGGEGRKEMSLDKIVQRFGIGPPMLLQGGQRYLSFDFSEKVYFGSDA